jgi:hypothetical protein
MIYTVNTKNIPGIYLTWEPVHLHPDAALFALTDSTAGSAAYGPNDTSTRDGLVRVERAGHHVGTVKQSRFGLLKSCVRRCLLG